VCQIQFSGFAKLADLPDRDRRHPIRTIIDATSKADRRSKKPLGPSFEVRMA
jgi:hypothetical protein